MLFSELMQNVFHVESTEARKKNICPREDGVIDVDETEEIDGSSRMNYCVVENLPGNFK